MFRILNTQSTSIPILSVHTHSQKNVKITKCPLMSDGATEYSSRYFQHKNTAVFCMFFWFFFSSTLLYLIENVLAHVLLDFVLLWADCLKPLKTTSLFLCGYSCWNLVYVYFKFRIDDISYRLLFLENFSTFQGVFFLLKSQPPFSQSLTLFSSCNSIHLPILVP